jgi:hypothetical protein
MENTYAESTVKRLVWVQICTGKELLRKPQSNGTLVSVSAFLVASDKRAVIAFSDPQVLMQRKQN